MYKLCIIGSSSIVKNHLTAAKVNGFKLYSITSLNKNSKNCMKLKKKFNINNYHKNWKECVDKSSKIKNICFLIAPRIKDTIKVLNYVSQYKRPILVEKPISISSKNFKNIKNKKNIFVGYNRLFYNSINYLKKNLEKNSLLSVVCAERNKKNFLTNSCHIIAILKYLFKNLKILNKVKNNQFINCNLKGDNNSLINLSLTFNPSCNFLINLKTKKKHINISPIEKLIEYKGIKIIKKNNIKIYEPIIKKKINDYDKICKPGFKEQYKEFKSFCNNPKIKIKNTIIFAKDVIKFSEKILH